MGHEATCICESNGSKAEVKALMEPGELILRGGLRKRLPLAQISRIRAENSSLCFTFEGERFALQLGRSIAAKWAKALLKPPPTLAKKLGITAETKVRMLGKADDPALEEALAQAKNISTRSGSLILARVNAPRDLTGALAKTAADLSQGVPIWLIFPKGPGHPLNEGLVRSTALAAGIVDTKVASVSVTLTALRFVRRKHERGR